MAKLFAARQLIGGVIHAWNNARGKKELTTDILVDAASEMSNQNRNSDFVYNQLIDATRISPYVLEWWINKQNKFQVNTTRDIRNITSLRQFWKDHQPEFILIHTTVIPGVYFHLISMSQHKNGNFTLFDSELVRPVTIETSKQYNEHFKRYIIRSVNFFKSLHGQDNKASDKTCIDLKVEEKSIKNPKSSLFDDHKPYRLIIGSEVQHGDPQTTTQNSADVSLTSAPVSQSEGKMTNSNTHKLIKFIKNRSVQLLLVKILISIRGDYKITNYQVPDSNISNINSIICGAIKMFDIKLEDVMCDRSTLHCLLSRLIKDLDVYNGVPVMNKLVHSIKNFIFNDERDIGYLIGNITKLYTNAYESNNEQVVFDFVESYYNTYHKSDNASWKSKF